MPGMKYGQDDGLNGINDTSLPYREASVEAKRSIAGDGDGLAKEKFHDGDVRSVENVPVRRLDEYEVDFSDTRNFCILRWVDIVKTTTERLNASGIWLCHVNMNTLLTYSRPTNRLQIP
jgi:hypothetical protein